MIFLMEKKISMMFRKPYRDFSSFDFPDSTFSTRGIESFFLLIYPNSEGVLTLKKRRIF